MKKLFVILFVTVFWTVGLTGMVYGIGEPFYSGNGCSLTLLQHSVYTDKSSWKFSGSCENGATFELLGSWKQSEKKAYESIKGTGSYINVTGNIVSVCPAGYDPWLNTAICGLQTLSGNFVNYYKIYTGKVQPTHYPISAASLSSGQKATFLAEATANGPSAGTPPPPPPPGPSNKILAASSHPAMLLKVPKIEAPIAGTLYHSNVPVKVVPPAGASEKKVKLEFQYNQSGTWVTKTVVADYDTSANPSGISVSKNQFPNKGDWRIKAKMATPMNAMWCSWVLFKVQ
jgi:hypothetical protein